MKIFPFSLFIFFFFHFYIILLDEFGELLLEPPSMTLPLALLSKMYSCESMDHPTIEKVTFSVVSLFENHGTGYCNFIFLLDNCSHSPSPLFFLVMSLLYSVAAEEVQRTLTLQTLFRSNRSFFYS